jgi:N-acetylmuramoyl-L-alanine amidase
MRPMRSSFIFHAILLFVSPVASAVGGIPGAPAEADHRQGDEIIVCGQLFHTGTSVVLFSDPGGYDGSKHTGGAVTRPSRPATTAPSTRPATTAPAFETLRGPDLTLPELRQHIDQFVLHFDGCGISRECFSVLERRRLSVHFMLDLDGTIYQTLDLREEAYHATIANARSIGVEIANVGTYEGPMPARIKEWYQRQTGSTRITIPAKLGSVHTPNFAGHPARPSPIGGLVQGRTKLQYDYTPEQYEALAHLAATLCTVFPKIQPDYPRQLATTRPATATTHATTRPATVMAAPEQPGVLIPHVLPPAQYETYQGLLGHYHVQLNKDDPGPAMQWDKIIASTRALMTPAARAENVKWRHQPVGVGPTRPTTQPTTIPSE